LAQDGPQDGPLDLAIRQLDQALATLEAGLAERARTAADRTGDLFEQDAVFAEDRARLAAELDAARAREKALEEVAAEASAALGRAAAEVRAALAAGEH
jgi:Domain of unknown function (DUF4164)